MRYLEDLVRHKRDPLRSYRIPYRLSGSREEQNGIRCALKGSRAVSADLVRGKRNPLRCEGIPCHLSGSRTGQTGSALIKQDPLSHTRFLDMGSDVVRKVDSLERFLRSLPNPLMLRMESPWPIHGRSMVSPRSVYGRSMVAPWSVHGQSMVGPW